MSTIYDSEVSLKRHVTVERDFIDKEEYRELQAMKRALKEKWHPHWDALRQECLKSGRGHEYEESDGRCKWCWTTEEETP